MSKLYTLLSLSIYLSISLSLYLSISLSLSLSLFLSLSHTLSLFLSYTHTHTHSLSGTIAGNRDINKLSPDSHNPRIIDTDSETCILITEIRNDTCHMFQLKCSVLNPSHKYTAIRDEKGCYINPKSILDYSNTFDEGIINFSNFGNNKITMNSNSYNNNDNNNNIINSNFINSNNINNINTTVGSNFIKEGHTLNVYTGKNSYNNNFDEDEEEEEEEYWVAETFTFILEAGDYYNYSIVFTINIIINFIFCIYLFSGSVQRILLLSLSFSLTLSLSPSHIHLHANCLLLSLSLSLSIGVGSVQRILLPVHRIHIENNNNQNLNDFTSFARSLFLKRIKIIWRSVLGGVGRYIRIYI